MGARILAFGEPIEPSASGPSAAAEDRAVVLDLAEHVREGVQALVHAGLVDRAGAFA